MSRTRSNLAAGFRLAGWTVRPRSNELLKSGEVVRVEPKPMEVLVYLADHAGEAVTREELMEAVWPGVFVTENALSRCVSQLRKVLEDDPREPRLIETIPTVGYRLIAPVEVSAADSDAIGVPEVAPYGGGDSQDRFSAVEEFPSLEVPLPQAAPASAMGRRPLLVGTGVVVTVAVALVLFVRPTSPPSPGPTRPLTSVPGMEVAPALSPDGSRIAYVQARHRGGGDLYVQGLGSETALQLTSGPARAWSPVWLPGEDRLAFVRCDSAACGLYSVPALGGEPRRLADAPEAEATVVPRGLATPPDGARLAFVAEPDGAPAALYLLDRRSGERRRLTSPPASSGGDRAPAFSPDGSTLAFVRRTGGGAEDLFTIPVEGGEPRRLTRDDRTLAGHAWSPDGRSLLFSSNRTGMYELWRVPARGGEPERVDGVVARDPGRPAVGAGRLVFEEWAFELNVWEAPADGSAEPVRRVASTWWDKHPHLDAAGTRIAFVSNRTGPPEVWVADRDGSGAARLTDLGGASVEAPRWAPDGRRLVFQARPDTQADLFVIEADGGPPRRLTTSDADDVAPRWSRDGRFVYFGSNRGGAWAVWKVPAEGGEPARVAEGYVAEESADGEHLFYAKRGEPGLWARPLGGGAERRLTDALAPLDWGSWAVTEAGVLVLQRTDGAARVLRIDPETGEAEPLPVVLGQVMATEPGLTATADGRHLLFAQVDRVESELMVVEAFE